ncbi:hypothetical protein OUZ56_029925 [Daphnia magna]|uniref:Uncharacterized protein n=1 Tax=Daphnia magna TaxID=35525 RepID=A0ABR0B899_9CRUS|nr:hypothetical protein OUZ56_029925 [Daphnia magna]
MTHHDPARASEPLFLSRFEPRTYRITGYPANHCTTVNMRGKGKTWGRMVWLRHRYFLKVVLIP